MLTFGTSAGSTASSSAGGCTGGTRLLMGTLSSSVEAFERSSSDSSSRSGLGLRRLLGRQAARAWVRAMVDAGSDKLNKYRQKEQEHENKF
jgi:hypothetical protein